MDEEPIELVERKGIGHPDSLANIIANDFSNRYSRHCLERFGAIPHHWADKVTIGGGKAEIRFGSSVRLEPIKAFQFGRMTQSVGDQPIDIDGLFEESVYSVMSRIFPGMDLRGAVDCKTLTHEGAGPDHPKEFYSPSTTQDVSGTQIEPKSNDTMIMTAYAGFSPMDILTIELENMLNSEGFKERYPGTGYDVKVLTARHGSDVDVTACIPFIAERTPSFEYYSRALRMIREEVYERLRALYPSHNITFNLNTKDFGEHAYLTLFGTSADKGGWGAVGRGNQFNGLITPTREMSIEAPSGKNPTHHSGRLYSEAAFRISRDIFRECGIDHYLNIVARNGDYLNDPAFVFVKCVGDSSFHEDRINAIVGSHLRDISGLSREIVYIDPVVDHVSRPRELYVPMGWLGG